MKDLTSGTLLARNTVWNVVGYITPMAVAVIAIPKLISSLGTDRFGILTIAWIVVGYFSLFTFGLGRAMTNLVAQQLAKADDAQLPAIIWTANLLMGVLGICGSIALVLLSPVVVDYLLSVPAELKLETRHAFYLLAISVPFVISTDGFRGILEARQQFGIINAVRIPMGISTFAAPLMLLPWSTRLTAIVGILVVARMIFWVLYMLLALRAHPALLRHIAIDMRLLPSLCGFGAWMTVSNLISPLLTYMDRILVGMMISLAAVTYYATPNDLVTKLLVLPGSLVGVLFPALSTALVSNPARAGKLFRRALKYSAVLLFPPTFLIVLFAKDGLSVWISTAFAEHSYRVLQLLTIGVFANALANMPFALIQGAGRPDITGTLHLIELPFYVVFVWAMTKYFGINGTAFAWAARATVDSIALMWFARRFIDAVASRNTIISGTVCAGIVFAVASFGMSRPEKLLLSVLVLLPFSAAVWFAFFTADERAFIQALTWRVLPRLGVTQN